MELDQVARTQTTHVMMMTSERLSLTYHLWHDRRRLDDNEIRAPLAPIITYSEVTDKHPTLPTSVRLRRRLYDSIDVCTTLLTPARLYRHLSDSTDVCPIVPTAV